MTDIVLFGTGNLGKRYIQAISKLENVNLFLCDISPASLSSVKDFLVQSSISELKYGTSTDTNEAAAKISSNTIVIVATTSNDRIKILRPVIEKHPKAIICEKPVTQNHEDYFELLQLADENNTKSFVDFTLRMQPFYQKIKSEISGVKNGMFFANLPKMGLACVGIHQIDLFMWLFNLTRCEIKNTSFLETYEQKRKGFFDVAGSIELESGNFRAFITNDNFENFRTSQIITEFTVYNVHEDQRVMTKVKKNPTGNLISENISYSFVSQYMTSVISSIVNDDFDSIPLPDFKSSYFQHKVLFDYLAKHSIKDLNFT